MGEAAAADDITGDGGPNDNGVNSGSKPAKRKLRLGADSMHRTTQFWEKKTILILMPLLTYYPEVNITYVQSRTQCSP